MAGEENKDSWTRSLDCRSVQLSKKSEPPKERIVVMQRAWTLDLTRTGGLGPGLAKLQVGNLFQRGIGMAFHSFYSPTVQQVDIGL